jgi:DNA topoisomerase-3
MTLNLIQGLYEKKLTTYPRVDTQYLSDDIYPKCGTILNGLCKSKINSQEIYMEPIKNLAKIAPKLPKSKRFFDTSKVTDHHAIIPTGVPAQGLTQMEQNVYDLIAKRFISAFYPDCIYSTTTVLGEVKPAEDAPKDEKPVEFKTTGKEILDPGWHAVYGQTGNEKEEEEEGAAKNDENGNSDILPTFVKGEKGEHIPTLTEKQTTPPPYYNEASLLRAMETAGKFVEDDELRAALKENGIGRPSSRAGIIETLFKRHYIRRERKRLVATATGIELIGLIHEKLLTSCELTGIWEKKLRDIEHHKYEPAQFIAELKEQIMQIVNQVLCDNTNRRITLITEDDTKKKKTATKKKATTKKAATKKTAAESLPADDSIIGKVCPICGKGTIIKGKTAYGCSNWKEGCKFRIPRS